MSQDSASPGAGSAKAGQDYAPVACSFHDTLEHAAVLRLMCRIRFKRPDGTEREVLATIDDVWSKGGEEFARLSTDDIVRLDRLESVELLPRGAMTGDRSAAAPPAPDG